MGSKRPAGSPDQRASRSSAFAQLSNVGRRPVRGCSGVSMCSILGKVTVQMAADRFWLLTLTGIAALGFIVLIVTLGIFLLRRPPK